MYIRLQKLEMRSCFQKRETLHEVKKFLNSMLSGKVLQINKVTKPKIRKSCNSFFVEVVSSLCFGDIEAPEPDLIKLLLDTVIQDTQTSKFSPYDDQDKTPTIRSFLLQLLLEHKYKPLV